MLSFILEGLSPAQRAQYLTNFAATLGNVQPKEWSKVANTASSSLEEDEWADLKDRVVLLEKIVVKDKETVEFTEEARQDEMVTTKKTEEVKVEVEADKKKGGEVTMWGKYIRRFLCC